MKKTTTTNDGGTKTDNIIRRLVEWCKSRKKSLRITGIVVAGTLLLVAGVLAWETIVPGGGTWFTPGVVAITEDPENEIDPTDGPEYEPPDAVSAWTVVEDEDGIITIFDNKNQRRDDHTAKISADGVVTIFDADGNALTGIEINFISALRNLPGITTPGGTANTTAPPPEYFVVTDDSGNVQTSVIPQNTTSPVGTGPGDSTTEPPPVECKNHSSTIELNGDTATSSRCPICRGRASIRESESGSGLEIRINNAGNYTITGTLNNGTIIVRGNPFEDVNITLFNATIACSFDPPLRIRRADEDERGDDVEDESVTIIIPSGTTSTLTDNRPRREPGEDLEESPFDYNSALFSRIPITITGNGRLNVNAGHFHGINSRELLTITSANINIKSVNHGFRSKRQTFITGSNIIVDSGGKGVRAAGDQRGHITIINSTLDITSVRDAVHAERSLNINNSRINALVSGGFGVGLRDAIGSKRGIRAGDNIDINRGTYVINSIQAAVLTSGNININSANMTISTEASAISAKPVLTITNSVIDVYVCNNGLRARDDGASLGSLILENNVIAIHAKGQAAQARNISADFPPRHERCMPGCHIPGGEPIDDDDD